jgi:hypothetical protein
MNNFTTHSTNPSTRLTFCSPTPYVKVCYNINSNIPDTVTLTSSLPVVNGSVSIPATQMMNILDTAEKYDFTHQ